MNYSVNASSTVTNVTTTGIALVASVASQANLSITTPSNPNVGVSITGARLGVVYVSGPGGKDGVANAVYPVLYDPSTRTISLDLGYFSGIAAGVAAVNGQTGILNIIGEGGNIFVSSSNQKIYISGSGIANSGDLAAVYTTLGITGSTLYGLITGFSGQLNLNYATTANLALTGANLYADITGLSGQSASTYATQPNLAATGATLYSDKAGLSGQVNTALTQSGDSL
jgi:hypothetical protein